MKKLLATFMFAAAVCGVSASENVILNGDFEEISKTAKATSPFLLGQIKRGWDLGFGPIVEMPKLWLPNNGKGKLRVMTVGPNGENKENVHSGKHAIYIETKGAHFRCAKGFKPGKYEFKFWAKGKGVLRFTSYLYGVKPETGSTKFYHIGGKDIYTLNEDTQGQWKEYKKVVEIGTHNKNIKSCLFAMYAWPKPAAFYLDDISLIPVK